MSQPPSRSVVGHAFGRVHRLWMIRPRRAIALATCLYVLVIIFALFLGILWPFDTRSVACTAAPGAAVHSSSAVVTADGFIIWNWGVLYLFAMPLAALLVGNYFRVLDNALLKLDEVIKPDKPTGKQFTRFVADRLRMQWSSWIFPVALVAPIFLTIIADGRDILAPLQSAVLLPSCSKDWSTLGYSSHRQIGAIWYLYFNLMAWTMQVFLGYCGVLVLLLTTGVLGTVFRYGIGKQEFVDAFLPPGAAPTSNRYHPAWKFCTARCGLEALDFVFLMFVGLNLFALVASAASIFVNVLIRHSATPGSAILAISSMLFVPMTCFWVFVPYFTHFPADFPSDFRPTKSQCEKPNPWPFGSEKLSWTLVTVTSGFWLFLLVMLVRAFFPALPAK